MPQQMRERIEVLGQLFRFITPILIGMIGWFGIQYLSSIDKKFEKIDLKFDNFLSSYHDMDKRVERLEFKVFDRESIPRRK